MPRAKKNNPFAVKEKFYAQLDLVEQNKIASSYFSYCSSLTIDLQKILSVLVSDNRYQYNFESEEVPLAGVDLVNKRIHMNQEGLFEAIVEKVPYRELKLNLNMVTTAFVFGSMFHEVAHVYYTVQKDVPQPESFYKLVINVVEDTHIERRMAFEIPFTKNYLFQLRNYMVSDLDCATYETKATDIVLQKDVFNMLYFFILYAYRPDYRWKIKIFPDVLVEEFCSIKHIESNEYRFELELKFAEKLFKFMKMTYNKEKKNSSSQDNDSFEDKLKNAVSKIQEEFKGTKPNGTDKAEGFSLKETAERFEVSASTKAALTSFGIRLHLPSYRIIPFTNDYTRMYNEFQRKISKLMYHSFASNHYNQRHGKFDIRRPYRTEISTNVFVTKDVPVRKSDIFLMIVIDHSGSMEGNNLSPLQDILLALTSSFVSNKVPVEILIYSDSCILIKKTTDLDAKKYYSALKIFKDSSDGKSFFGGTRFESARNYIVKRFSSVRNKDKCLIVATDGADSDPSGSNVFLQNLASKYNVIVSGFGLGIRKGDASFNRMFNAFEKFNYSNWSEVFQTFATDLYTFLSKKFLLNVEGQK